MQILTWFSMLVFAFVVKAAEAPTELQIDTTYKPPECPVTAKSGDSIKVHYVSTWKFVVVFYTMLRKNVSDRQAIHYWREI